MLGWIPNVFESIFNATITLGLASFVIAILAFVLIVLIITIRRDPNLAVMVAASGGTLILLVYLLNIFIPPPKGLQDAPKQLQPAAPAQTAYVAAWADTGLQADWGGRDEFYGAGSKPQYKVDGRSLCDDTMVGRLAVCWESRTANASSMASGVAKNIDAPRNDWCAYKHLTLSFATTPDGRAQQGKVYLCAKTLVDAPK
jgi:hypothetical protein